MSNVAKLKKKAAEFEAKKDFAKALAVYVEMLDNFDQYAAELDVSLFNRVGDLMLRQGNVADAVDYYERAVVRYVDGGFYNNAIALCNKILRHSPGRASVYYTLGKISAHKGFTLDAKQNFLEYADRMQKAGNLDEAFRALKEFADLCPGQDDIRLMLADQLSKLDRKDEALEQLQILWARFNADGKGSEAQAILTRIKAIDPSVEPQAKSDAHSKGGADLVFLDLGEPTHRPVRPAPSAPPPGRKKSSKAPPPAAVADLPLLDSGEDEEPAAPPSPPPSRGYAPPRPAPPSPKPPVGRPVTTSPERLVPEPSAPPPHESGSIMGLERTSLDDSGSVSDPASILDIEPNAFEEKPPPPPKPKPSSIIEQEASASLLSEDDLVEDQSPTAEPTAHQFEEIAPNAPPPPVDANTSDSSDFTISHDSSSLDVDISSGGELGSQGGMWQQQTPESVFGSDFGSLTQDPSLLRSDAIGFDDPLTSTNGTGAFDNSTPLIELDPSLGTDLPPIPQGPASLRQSTISAERSVEALRTSVEADPENWTLRRELAEAMLESGDREGGVHELEAAMMGAERANELDFASSLAEEIARLAPETVRFHQKRVEYAFRTNDKLRLIEAYLALAGALLNAKQGEKARAVYQRVLDLAPDDIRAQAALESIKDEPEPPPEPETKAPARKAPSRVPGASPVRTRSADPEPRPGEAGFVNLGELLRSADAPKSTRMIVNEEEPTGDEEADFADMLKKFKQGIAENVAQEDYQSHYDLGVAFKEMGLVDEAIAEFQKALKAPSNRLPTYEAIGQCFIEKQQYGIAATVLARALGEGRYSDEELVGLLYLLGRATQALNRIEEALAYYQRVFVVDIEFRDVVKRINELERVAR
ncbi:MAG TPA: tetratricopeptide repeat protein [Gemmatimonadaceae bacterium]|nr:tetratricopeptide repeat protein [Gemmatimonadaceae bacterium]